MLRITAARVRLSLIVLGCAVLAASLWIWAQTSGGGEDGEILARASSSGAPGVPGAPGAETAEIWRSSANCERPYFVKAVLRSKAALKAIYNAAPQEVRASRERSIFSEAPSAGRAGINELANGAHAARPRGAAAMEHDAALHAQYAEWYATVSKLEIQESQWEERLLNVTDQKVILGEATRRSFKAYGTSDAGQPAAKRDFEHYVLFLLGLGGFPADEEIAITASCVTVVPVNIFAGAERLGKAWRWPVDHVAAVSFGVELVLIGILFIPISIWISTGDLRSAARHIGYEARRLVALARRHNWISTVDLCITRRYVGDVARRLVALARALLCSKFVLDILDLLLDIAARTRRLVMVAMDFFRTGRYSWGRGR